MSMVLKIFGKTVVYILLIVTLVTTIFPLAWMILTSLKETSDIFKYPPTLLPSHVIFDNYSNMWSMAPWGRYFFNSVYYSVASVAGVVITSIASGYAFSKLQFKGRNAMFLMYIGTMMIPGQVTIIPVYMILSQLHWINTYAGLIVPGLTSAFGCFLMRQFIAGLPNELIESALLDGAGHIRILGTIIIPLIKPAIATLSIFMFMGTWNNFFWPLIVTNNDVMRTVQIGLSAFQNQYGTIQWGPMMAAATMVSLPLLILFLFAQQYFVEGITMTGIKG